MANEENVLSKVKIGDKYYNLKDAKAREDLAAEVAAREAADAALDAKKVNIVEDGTNAKSEIFNEKDGGGAKLTGKNGVVAYVGTHDSIGGEIGTQIYVDKASGTESTIIDVTQNGAYYTKGTIVPGAQRDVAANEIAVKGDVTAEATTRSTADAALQTAIDNEATTRSSADTTLQSNIDAEASARATADETLQDNIDAEETARKAADSGLDTRIKALESKGRYLSTWNAETGKPDTYPEVSQLKDNKYNYRAGDYYIVNKVAASNNLMPDGAYITYDDTTTPATWTVPTKAFTGSNLNLGDQFQFDGTSWTYIASATTVAFQNIQGAARDNNSLKTEFESLEAADTAEATARAAADATLQANIDAEESARIAADNTKVDKEISSTAGKALIFNEADGGGAKFENVDGVESFVGVNNGGADGIAAQIYADKLVDGKWQGAKLDIKNGGIYYTVGNKSAAERDVAANEVAVKGDVSSAVSAEESRAMAAEALLVPKTTTIAGVDLQDNITTAELQTALGLKGLAYADSASGSYTPAGTISQIDATPAGTITVNDFTQTSTSATISAKSDYTPAGSNAASAVTITPSKEAFVQSLKAGNVDAAAFTEGSFTPASISEGFFSAGSYTEGTLNQGVLPTINTKPTTSFTTEGLVASVGTGDDAECLIFTAASTSSALTDVTLNAGTLPSWNAGSYVAPSIDTTKFSGGSKAADTFSAEKLPVVDGTKDAWTGYTAAEAAAQTFTGTKVEQLIPSEIKYDKATSAGATFAGTTNKITPTFSGTAATITVNPNT